MPIITDQPADIPTTNALDGLSTGDEPTPAAYLSFGTSPAAMEDPPEQGETRIYVVRARCSEEHGPIERKDGEMRYTRKLVIQAVWLPGQTEPVADQGQGALFNEDGTTDDGDPDEDAADAEDETGDEPDEPEDQCPDDPAELDTDL